MTAFLPGCGHFLNRLGNGLEKRRFAFGAQAQHSMLGHGFVRRELLAQRNLAIKAVNCDRILRPELINQLDDSVLHPGEHRSHASSGVEEDGARELVNVGLKIGDVLRLSVLEHFEAVLERAIDVVTASVDTVA
jgi:hypothetical protein